MKKAHFPNHFMQKIQPTLATSLRLTIRHEGGQQHCPFPKVKPVGSELPPPALGSMQLAW